MTAKAVAVGLFLAFVFGAADAYLGMRAGQTVAATILAADLNADRSRVKEA